MISSIRKMAKMFIGVFILVIISVVIIIALLPGRVHYLPCNIPGSLMAVTIPPLGTFMEQQTKRDPSVLRHELVHWEQYRRLGFWGFYSTYLKEYIKYGRINGPLEKEARRKANMIKIGR